MHKIGVTYSEELGESTFCTTLKNGLNVYICNKKGFSKKIGMFGTKYGSLTNDFIDITTNKRIKVPDGIAHFLEHKLFEKEGANALDLFSKMGVSSNAYTSFDQTVYFFETVEKFEESIEMLVKLIKEPYFTKENVQKEQGIIGQEIKMYEDEPNYMVYFNALRAMYQKNTVKIDIAGTIESIANITPDLLYTCYNTFYSPQNMFFLVVGDVDIDETINLIEKNVDKYDTVVSKDADIIKYSEDEPKEIAQKEIKQKMDIYLPALCIGYKLDTCSGKDIIKNECIVDIISDMYFSKISDFYEEEYNKGYINDAIDISYEGSKTFSHVIISTSSLNIDKVEEDILNYIEKIKSEPIDEQLFQTIKRKKIGENIFSADNLTTSYRRVIDSILNDVDTYFDVKMYNDITSKDIEDFLKNLNEEKRVSSKIISK